MKKENWELGGFDSKWHYRWWLFENRIYDKYRGNKGVKAFVMMNFIPLSLCFVILVGTPLFLGGFGQLMEWLGRF